MTIPVINAIINFSTGPVFASPMILDQGILDTNVLADSVAVTVDVSSQVNSINITRGRNVTADQFQTGQMSLRILDQNGDFNPQNPSSPYANLLTPMRKVTITATYSGVTYPLFAGYILSYTYTMPNQNDGTLGYTTIAASDAFRLATQATIQNIAGAAAGDLASTRVTQILNQIQWPNAMRSIETALTTVQADTGTVRTSLNAMQNMEQTEYGALYVSPAGNFVFKNRTTTSTSVAATPTVFAQTGAGIRYYSAAWVLNDQLIYNQGNVTRVGGTTQSVTNAVSTALYFYHTWTQTGLMMQTDAVALQLCQAYIASRALTSVRVDQLLLDLYTTDYDAGIKAALNLDFFDPVTITSTQPGGTELSKTEQIFGVNHVITPGSWKTTFTTLEPIIDAFILNSTSFGVLDTSVLSY